MKTFTDAADIYHSACAYSIFGALLTRHRYRACLQGGMPARWTNLWVVLLGDSGSARKTTAIAMANDILMRVDDKLLGPNDGSPEGFLAHLAKSHREVKNNAATILIAGEFSTMLTQMQRNYSASMKPLLMDFYDVPALFKKALAKSAFEIPQPRVSILGGIASELMPALTTQEDWLGGFFSRCLIVFGARTREMKRSKTPDDATMAGHADALWELMKVWRETQFKRGRPLFDYAPDALKVVDKLPKSPDEPNLKLSLSRASVHLMKLAAIEQIDEDPKAKAIGKAATQRALEFVMYWWNSVPDIIDQCFTRGREDFEGDRLAKRIHRYVLCQPDAQSEWSAVMKNCVLDSERMKRAVASLQDAGMVTVLVDEEDGTRTLQAKARDPQIQK